MQLSFYGGIPREKIPWYPTIDKENCVGCQECFNFCHNNVLKWDEVNNRPEVINPFNCVVGCSACANLCPNGAIKFPSKQELMDRIKKLRDEKKLEKK